MSTGFIHSLFPGFGSGKMVIRGTEEIRPHMRSNSHAHRGPKIHGAKVDTLVHSMY